MQATRGLHLVTMPLTPLRFTSVAGSVGLLMAVYCLAHGLIADDRLRLTLSLTSGVASTLPWLSAWEGLKRLGAQRLRALLAAAILIAALVSCAALEYTLSSIYFSDDTFSFTEFLYRRLPILLVLCAAMLLLLPSMAVRRAAVTPDAAIVNDKSSPTQRLRRLQTEQVLNVPTRSGVLAVPAADIEYVRAAGNYVELNTADRTLLVRKTLSDLNEQLRTVGFVRVHRSLLVNALHIVGTRHGPRGRRFVGLRGGAELPIGRQFLDSACVQEHLPQDAFVTTARRSSHDP